MSALATYRQKTRIARMNRPLDRPVGEIRTTRNLMRYGFAFGKLTARASQMLDNATVDRLLDTHTFQERIKLLSTTSYQPFLKEVHSLADLECALRAAVEDAVSLVVGAGLDPVFEEFFRLESGYAAGDEHRFFAERMALAYQSEVPFVVQMVQLEIDSANARLLLRKRFAHIATDALFGADGGKTHVLVGDGTVPAKALEGAYRNTKDAQGLARALVKFAPFRSLAPDMLEDVQMLDVALRSLYEQFVKRGIRMGAGPEPLVAYVARIQSETALLNVLMVGLESGVDKDMLRTFLVARRGGIR